MQIGPFGVSVANAKDSRLAEQIDSSLFSVSRGASDFLATAALGA